MGNVIEIDASTGVVTERDMTPEEQAQRATDLAEQEQHEAALAALHTNRDTLEQQAKTAMAQNRAAIAATAPTNAQVIAQVKALSAQNNALIRLVLGLLESVD